MKIFEIGTGYTPIPAQVAAATESVVEELTKAYIKNGQPVEILDISAENRAAHDLPIIQVPVPSVFAREDVALGLVHKLKRVVYSVALAGKLKKILKDVPQRVVLHFHNQYNLFFFLKLVPRKLREKSVTVYTNHNGVWSLPWEEAESILHKRYFQEIEAMKRADLVFVLNRSTKENAQRHLGIADERIVQIPNGVNTEVYHPLPMDEVSKTKAQYNLQGKRIVLQVGSINENKGQGRALRFLAPLLRQHPELMFAYVGGVVSQEYHQEVQEIARELQLEDRVRYLGAVSPGADMNRIYNMVDATIFASRFEGFPLVCIEALSAGIPVIVCPDTKLDFGDGCVKPEKDAMEACVAHLLTDGEYLKTMKCKARENALENFRWEKIAQDSIAAIQNLQ